VTILRVGTSEKYADGWAKAFGKGSKSVASATKKKAPVKAVKKAAAKKTVKKAAKPVAKKATKKKK
jgi:hypothetical protein